MQPNAERGMSFIFHQKTDGFLKTPETDWFLQRVNRILRDGDEGEEKLFYNKSNLRNLTAKYREWTLFDLDLNKNNYTKNLAHQ